MATRGSALARRQTDLVISALGFSADLVVVDVVVVETVGDRRTDVPIAAIGGQGVFAKEVQAAVLDGRADLAVHSAKDLPSGTLVEGLVIAAVPERGDPRDALVGCRLDDLAAGARVGTGAVRRRAQLAHMRPDLVFGELRGNIDTRLAKAAQFDAIVVAAAALERLDRLDVVAELLPADVFVPQVGQGALAVECRADDDDVRQLLATIDHEPSHRALLAERAFLAELGGDCDLPVGGYATVAADGVITLTGLLADGGHMRRHTAEGDDPVELGQTVAKMVA